MTDDRRDMRGFPPDSPEAKALSALRRLPRAGADPVTRDKARAAFLATAGEPESRSARFVNLVSAVAVMAALLAVAIFGRAPTDEWIVLDVVNPAGVEAPAGSALAVGAVIEPGFVSLAPGTELELQLGDRLRFRMMPGTEIELPAGPGRWFNRSREFHLVSGEIFGTTGGHRLGFDLDFLTEELKAELTGTTFAVFCTDDGSCVCLWEGGITVTPIATNDEPTILDPKRRVWIYKDDREREVLPLSDMETMKLQMMADGGLAETSE